MKAKLILRLVGRDWRAGELRLLLVALLVAVGAVTAISLFVDRLNQALLTESATFLAADRVIASSRPIPEAFRAAAAENRLLQSETITFRSMIFADDAPDATNQLVSVKAVASNYPLRGVLRVSGEPFGIDQVARGVPDLGEVWLDSRLFPALGLKIGDMVAVGYARFQVTRVLAGEPDRGGSIFDLGPRILMRVEDVASTKMIQPGSRIYYRLLLAGDDKQLANLKAMLTDQMAPNYRWQSIKEASPSIGSALDRAESFLMLGGLFAVLLAGVAIALSAHRYSRRHYDHVGVLKTLGATPSDIQWGYVAVLVLVGFIGVFFGLALGTLVHVGIVAMLSEYLPVVLPLPGLRSFLVGAITGFVCLFAFAFPPLLALRNISPMMVIRRDVRPAPVSIAVTCGFAGMGSLALLVWYTGSIGLTLWAIVGAAGVCGAFAIVALGLLHSGRVLGMQAGSVWRLALAGLQRRHRENVAQITIFGLAIMLLLVLLLVRVALLDEWRAQLPENAPNHFVMNITEEDVDEVQALLDNHTEHDDRLFPMLRGRVVGINGKSVQDWDALSGATVPSSLRSERNLTWAEVMPSNNLIVEGEWWSTDEVASLISVESDYARGAGLELGDELEFDVGGLPVVATIANTRRVEWESMQPNFFIIFSRAALRDFPTTYMTSFYLESNRKKFLNQLLLEHPTVTVIEIDELIKQIQAIIARITHAVELVLILVVVAGVLVLTASIQASRDSRMKEHALLRALGGTKKLIAGSLLSEFATLGAFAGIVAVIGAEITAYLLQTNVFELTYEVHMWLWITGPVVGAALVATVGYLGTRMLVRSPPSQVLRDL